MTNDSLHWYEKTAVGLGMAAQGLIVTRWYIGTDVPHPYVLVVLAWLTVIISVAAGVAFDAVVVVTTMGRREGRQSWWGIATAAAAAVFSAAVALHMFGGPSAGPWLHVGYPVITFLFVQHLAAPRKSALSEVEQLTAWFEQSRLEAEQAREDAEQARFDLEMATMESKQWHHTAAQHETRWLALEKETERLGQVAEQAIARAEQAENSGELDRPAIAQTLINAGVTMRTAAALLNVSTGTVNNWTKGSRNGVHKEETAL